MIFLFLKMLRVRNLKGSNGKSVKDTKFMSRVMVGFNVEVALCAS